MPTIHKRRPAETRTAAIGSATAIVQAFTAPWWCALATGVVAWAPAAFTWLVENGGLVGVVKRIFHGDD